MKRELRWLEQQKRFVSDASHELRTPVTVILGYSDLLSRWGREDAKVLAEGMASIRSEAENMQELIEKLREGVSLSAADVWERLAATVACKAAIKAHWDSADEELIALARRVLRGEVTHCPHGRPVMQVFTRAELDKRFGRIT